MYFDNTWLTWVLIMLIVIFLIGNIAMVIFLRYLTQDLAEVREVRRIYEGYVINVRNGYLTTNEAREMWLKDNRVKYEEEIRYRPWF